MNDAHDTWEVSAMHDLNCHECHIADMATNIHNVVEVLTKDPQVVTKHAEIDNEICEECHASNDYQWKQILTTEGHLVHFYSREHVRPDCIDCHGMNMHVFTPPEEVCQGCHSKDTSMDSPEAAIHCIDCHEFSNSALFPESDDCINCHDFTRTQSFMTETIHNKIKVETDCMSCHNPHTESTYEDCLDCHNPSKDGLHEIPNHQSCALCHSPHRSTSFEDICLSCHIDRETHYQTTKCELCHSFTS